MTNDILKLRILQDELGKLLEQAPAAIGIISRDHFKENFIKQGFDDNGLTRWPKRKRETKQSQGRGVLIKKGRLKNSIRVISTSQQQVIVGTDIPYAKAHNEGETITYPARNQILHFSKKGRFSKINRAYYGQKVARKSYSIRMPQRQFMGNSTSLVRKIDTYYTKRLNTIQNLIK